MAYLHYATREFDRASDLAKAREIFDRYNKYVLPANVEIYETVMKAIADGIALGRSDGLAMVAKEILRRKENENRRHKSGA
jgi:hypothetical protein